MRRTSNSAAASPIAAVSMVTEVNAGVHNAASLMSSQPVTAKSLPASSPTPAQAEHDAEGDDVVVADRGGRRLLHLEQRLDRLGAVLALRRTAQDQGRIGMQVIGLERVEKALMALEAGRDAVGAADHRNAAVAERNQMLGRQIRSLAMVVAGEIERHALHEARDLHAGHAEIGDALQGFRRGAFRRTDDQAVGIVFAHGVDEAILMRRVFGRVAQEHRLPDPRQRALDRGGELGEIRIVQFVDGDADGVGALGAQARGAAIIDVAERAHGFEHALAGRFRDQRALAQHERYGRGRDAGMAREIAQRQPRAFAVEIFIANLPVHRGSVAPVSKRARP